MDLSEIQPGDQVFVEEGGADCGAVREIGSDALLVFFENCGESRVPVDAVRAAHDRKVILDCDHLDPRVRAAVNHAHDSEQPGL